MSSLPELPHLFLVTLLPALAPTARHLPPSLFLFLVFESSIHHPHNSSVPIVLFLSPLLMCFPTITSFFLGLSTPCGPHYRKEEMIFLFVGASLMLTLNGCNKGVCVCTHRCTHIFSAASICPLINWKKIRCQLYSYMIFLLTQLLSLLIDWGVWPQKKVAACGDLF